MKHILFAVLATAVAASTATAGSLADPVVTADVIVAEATSSSSGVAVVALLAVLMSVPLLD